MKKKSQQTVKKQLAQKLLSLIVISSPLTSYDKSEIDRFLKNVIREEGDDTYTLIDFVHIDKMAEEFTDSSGFNQKALIAANIYVKAIAQLGMFINADLDFDDTSTAIHFYRSHCYLEESLLHYTNAVNKGYRNMQILK